MLQKLPQEILGLVIGQLTDAADIKHVTEVCKSLYASCIPYLYESIFLEPSIGELDLKAIDIKPLRAACERGHLLYTRDLKITSKFHRNLTNRCPHNDDYRFREASDDSEVDAFLMPLLKKLEDGKLRSLNWDLGVCVPKSILGPSGYLPLRQPNLEALYLVTDGSCEDSGIGLDISSFEYLKRLSWIGPRCIADINSLAESLAKKSHQIVELDLDFVLLRDSEKRDREIVGLTAEFEDENDLLAKKILGIPNKQIQNFNALRVLSLAAVSFLANGKGTPCSSHSFDYQAQHQAKMGVVKQISDVFDFSKIIILKLRFCPGWEELLDLLAQSPHLIRLQSLEIQSTIRDVSGLDNALPEFLEAFAGLETLILSTHQTSNALNIWRSARRHRGTLRRFVYHERRINVDPDSAHFEGEFDVPDLSFNREDIRGLRAEPFKNPLSELELTSAGLCCMPEFMTEIAHGFVVKNTLEVLHVRQSGPDFKRYVNWSRDEPTDDVLFNRSFSLRKDDALSQLGKAFGEFAQWVFGPTGILSLRLLAFGDFSYNGRFAKYNMLLCRMEQQQAQITIPESQRLYFRPVKGDDKTLHELLDKHSDVLEACPADSLFKFPGDEDVSPPVMFDSETESSFSTGEWESFEESSGEEEDSREEEVFY